MPFTGRPRPDRPSLRPAYQGSNPISDVWSLQALRMVDRFLVRAVEDPSRRRGAGEDAAGGRLRRRRVRQRRRAPAARHVVSGVGPRERLSRARIRRGSSARAARHLGDPQRAGGVPLSPPRPIRSGTSKPPRRSARPADVAEPMPARSLPIASRGSCSGCGCRTASAAIGYTIGDIPALVEGTLPLEAGPSVEAMVGGAGTGVGRVIRRGGTSHGGHCFHTESEPVRSAAVEAEQNRPPGARDLRSPRRMTARIWTTGCRRNGRWTRKSTPGADLRRQPGEAGLREGNGGADSPLNTARHRETSPPDFRRSGGNAPATEAGRVETPAPSDLARLQRSRRTMDTLRQDLLYALRILRKERAYSPLSSSRWRSASERTPRSSPWSARCCSGRFPIPSRSA